MSDTMTIADTIAAAHADDGMTDIYEFLLERVDIHNPRFVHGTMTIFLFEDQSMIAHDGGWDVLVADEDGNLRGSAGAVWAVFDGHLTITDWVDGVEFEMRR
tara:strand:- start:819 stop:1124 length:306 start_codon:yes stop_codon:yes gene_type:complete